MKNSSPTFDNLSTTSSSEHAGVHIITMHKPPKNRLNSAYAQTIIRALRHIERDLVKPSQPGKLGLMHEAGLHEVGTRSTLS